MVENPGPHLFMIAEDCVQSLVTEQANQSIIITGNSGSGKTESCKILLAYVAQANIRNFTGDLSEDLHRPGGLVPQNDSTECGVGSLVLASNPVLEAFGNAKTSGNNNSSRFGKFIQVGIQA